MPLGENRRLSWKDGKFIFNDTVDEVLHMLAGLMNSLVHQGASVLFCSQEHSPISGVRAYYEYFRFLPTRWRCRLVQI